MLRVAAVVLLLYFAYAALLFFGQRGMAFPVGLIPSPGDLPLPPDAERVSLDLPFGAVDAIFMRAGAAGSGPAPAVLFAHGNAELIEYNLLPFEPWRAAGYHVLLVEYPGYGRSAGSPSQATLDAAWLAAFDWLVARPEVDPARVVAIGRSLGSGPTLALAATRPVAAVVLQSAFASTTLFAHERLVPGFLVRDRWDNIAAIRRFGGPVLAGHGRRDEVIPVRHGERIAALPNVTFDWYDCGHNDCPYFDDAYRVRVLAFLAERGIAPRTAPSLPGRG
jgi:hypothetical protein